MIVKEGSLRDAISPIHQEMTVELWALVLREEGRAPFVRPHCDDTELVENYLNKNVISQTKNVTKMS